jgi:acyl transferase domain-containing protein
MSEHKDAVLERSLKALQKLKTQLDQTRAAAIEPIAVIGLACRLPAAGSIDAYWSNLLAGVDAMVPVPAERWPVAAEAFPATGAAVRGGFLADVAGFDAAFFDIAPREAVALDPQHRLALKLAWEALEDAGLPAASLARSPTGVFLGIVAADYRERTLSGTEDELGPYSLTGSMLSAAAGRISYTLSLTGPCITTETACSSSLVAVHQACQSLRQGECELALAGGVNLILAPTNMRMLVRMGALSSDGRCKTFDAQADGLVRGEGGGVVVLKRLSDAQRDGDRIDALILGSAVNHDGRSAGFTAPNGRAQQLLLRTALSRAGVPADSISYVETHGTGTALGDPIEADALAAVLAPNEGRSCVLGAVKTGIGHLEAAAGIAGLLKVVLALRHEHIPPNLNFRGYNPNSTALGRSLVVPTQVLEWPRCEGQPRRAGVSAFGITGTNAHAVLQEAPLPRAASPGDRVAPVPGDMVLLPLSARSEGALAGLARRYRTALGPGGALDGQPLARVAAAMATQRDLHPLRCAIVVPASGAEADRAQLDESLAALCADEPHPALVRGRQKPSGTKLAWVFAGQGSQWQGMAQDLLGVEGPFRSALLAADAALRPHLGWSVAEELQVEGLEPGQAAIRRVQPVLFALGVALDAHWRGLGLRPTAVVGHSLGEVAAACAAGHLSLEDGARLVTARSALLERVAHTGGMAIVERRHEDALADIAPYAGRIEVAGLNSPRLTVLSGELESLLALREELHARQVFCRIIQDAAPSHSRLLEPELDAFRREIADIRPRSGPGAFYSTVRAAIVPGPELTPDYWVANLRQAVLFAPTFEHLLKDGYRHFVEMAPSATLTVSCDEIIQAHKLMAVVLPALRKGQTSKLATALVLGGLFANGYPLDMATTFGAATRPPLPLPTYAWEEKRFWTDWHEDGVGGAAITGTADASPVQSTRFLAPQWTQLPRWESSEPRRAAGRWLVLSDRNGRVEPIAVALERAGAQVVRLSREVHAGRLAFDPLVPQAFDSMWRDHFGADTPCAAVLDGWTLDAADATKEAEAYGCGPLLHLVQSMLSARMRNLPRIVTVETLDPEVTRVAAIFAAPATGLLRSLSYELPDLAPKTLAWAADTDPTHVVDELLADDREQRVRLGATGREVERLQRLPVPQDHATAMKPRPDATYLITGGFGGLGLALAEQLVRDGARHLALMARRAVPDEAQARRIDALRVQGVQVLALAADVSCREELDRALARLATEAPPLVGVFHAAGLLLDGLAEKQSLATLQTVMAPKISGAWNLHELTSGLPLEIFVLYGSVSALIGSPGQGNYAAANAFLPALAAHRRAKGLPATCMEWGAFSDTGLAADDDLRAGRLEARGMHSLTVAEGHAALGWALASGLPRCGVVEFNARQWFDFYPRRASDAYLSALADTRADPSRSASAANFLVACQAASPSDRVALSLVVVREEVARVLRYSPQRIDVDKPFKELGLDSLTGLELRNRLESRVGLSFSATLIWSCPTVSALADHVASQLAPSDGAGPAPAVDLSLPATDTLADMSEQDLLLRLTAELKLTSASPP